MVSARCTGQNLINHLVQTKKILDYDISYVSQAIPDKEWLCVMTFNSNGQDHSYIHDSSNQKKAFNTILSNIAPILTELAGIKIPTEQPILLE